MHANTEQLRGLMDAHKLKTKDVAEQLDRSEQTVRIWRMENGPRVIPDHMLQLLRLKLESSEGAAE